jgi:lipoprotein-anchoring transpeptidase ErfK/SrfK
MAEAAVRLGIDAFVEKSMPDPSKPLHRRRVLSLALAGGVMALLPGCRPLGRFGGGLFRSDIGWDNSLSDESEGDVFNVEEHYAERLDEEFPIPAVPYDRIDPTYLRQRIPYQGTEEAGTIVVDPDRRHLYYVQRSGIAIRYGVGVGREGFGWEGFARVGRKASWPRWTPPAEMIERRPDLEPFRNGMPPGLDNPLGARALYLFKGKQDTLYRLHGTNEPFSIGKAVSSGCIRMFNQDVIDLHRRAKVGTNVVVLPHGGGG